MLSIQCEKGALTESAIREHRVNAGIFQESL